MMFFFVFIADFKSLPLDNWLNPLLITLILHKKLHRSNSSKVIYP